MADDVDIRFGGESINQVLADEGYEFSVNGITGDRLLGSSLEVAGQPGRDGDRLIDKNLPSRTITVTYTLQVDKEASHEALEKHAEAEQILAGLLHRPGLAELEMSHRDGYFRAEFEGASKSSDYAHMHQGTLTFFCPQPFLYGSSLTTTIAGGLVAVDSNYYVEPVIIWTTNQSVGAAWIEVDGERLTIDTGISSGQQIRIDSQRMETRIGGVLNVENIGLPGEPYPVIRDGSSITRSPGGSIEFRYQARHI
ncbi:distal tail protein Dit [Nesterenkonia haasae]|uniref:distal tail protein Dit n=1 Tax=Nesterenkonia haasae TaxID=2587813 RepID=UPI001391B08C|nr:distal tail protein Dit [Nesterenkonia haasae]